MSRAALVLVCCTSLMGCIITRDPGYSLPRNTPPVVLEDPELPFTRFIDVYLDRGGSVDGGVGGAQNPDELIAIVRDPDIEQDLTGLVFIDRNPNSMRNIPRDEFRIPSEMDETPETRNVRRPFDFAGPFTADMTGCHVLELHVAQAFNGTINPLPADDPLDPDGPTDLGRGVWFLRVLENEEDETALRGCEP